MIGHWIDGREVPSVDGRSFASIDPATEAPIADVARGGEIEIDRACRAAQAALQGPWGRLAPVERGALLFRLAELILAARDELAALESQDVGKPLREARGDIDGVVATLRYNAGAADKIEGTTIPLGPAVVDMTLLEPLGVTAHIVPWNYPLGMAMRSLAPALAAGCTAVIKPAEQTPLSALRLGALCALAGIPPGVVNVVAGTGEEAGAALVRHPLVRGITFTGSVETGRKVAAAAGHGIKPVVLELGGKNPLLVFPDADLDRLVDDLADAAFGNSGQVCSACSRLLVHESIADPLVERIAARAQRITIGPPADDPDLGPLVSAEQHAKVVGHIEAARRAGARLVCGGGGRPPGLERGFYVEPTLFDRVDPALPIAREEVFGPVLAVTRFGDEAEALALANGLDYGLCAGVYTADIGRALRLARALEAGSVWINGWFLGGQQAPTGGIKASGIGKERGLLGVRNYLHPKNIAIRL